MISFRQADLIPAIHESLKPKMEVGYIYFGIKETKISSVLLVDEDHHDYDKGLTDTIQEAALQSGLSYSHRGGHLFFRINTVNEIDAVMKKFRDSLVKRGVGCTYELETTTRDPYIKSIKVRLVYDARRYAKADLFNTFEDIERKNSVREYQLPIQIRPTHTNPDNTSRQLYTSRIMVWEDGTITPENRRGLARLEEMLPKIYEALDYHKEDRSDRWYGPITGNPMYTVKKLLDTLKANPHVSNAEIANMSPAQDHVNLKIWVYNK